MSPSGGRGMLWSIWRTSGPPKLLTRMPEVVLEEDMLAEEEEKWKTDVCVAARSDLRIDKRRSSPII